MSVVSKNSAIPKAVLHPQPIVRYESTLRDGEQPLLEQTFKRLPDVIRIYDVDTRQIIFRNRSFASVLGYHDELPADETLLHPDDVNRVQAQLTRALLLDDDDSTELLYRLKLADGNWKWFTERQVIFKRHSDGTVAQILKTARCCTDLHIGASQYPPSRAELLEHVVEYSLPNFALFLFDHHLRYQLAIGIFLERLGLLTDSVEGHTLYEVVSPSTLEWLEPAHLKALTGEEIYLERKFNNMFVGIHCLPVLNEQGDVIAGMALMEDITGDKQSTAALIESEQRFAQLSQNIKAIFWILDTQQRQLLYISRAFTEIFELTPEVAYQDPSILLDVIHPDDRNMVFGVFMDTFTDGYHDIKFRLQLPSGKLRWLSSRAFPIYDDAGKLYRVAGLTDDITQQMEIEKVTFDLALERERRRLLSQFISTTSHELRTPLTIINTSLYLMKKICDPAKQSERLHIIEHQVAQLARLVGQMHMLHRIENAPDNHPNAPELINLNDVLSRLEKDYAAAMAKKDLGLHLALADKLPAIYANADWILVALQNVWENAITYTDSGRITIRTASQDQRVVLTITDTGIGIDATDLPHIFEQFYKIEGNKRRDTVSAGLGLAITQRIMDLTGGKIEVESQPGQGSTFRLTWPVTQPTVQP